MKMRMRERRNGKKMDLMHSIANDLIELKDIADTHSSQIGRVEVH